MMRTLRGNIDNMLHSSEKIEVEFERARTLDERLHPHAHLLGAHPLRAPHAYLRGHGDDAIHAHGNEVVRSHGDDAPRSHTHASHYARPFANQPEKQNSAAANHLTPEQLVHLCRAHYISIDIPFIFWLFVICCVIGLFGETLVSYPIDGIWKNRSGLIWGPFSPIYGLGGVLFTIVLNKYWKCSTPVQFLVSALAGGLVEGTAGFLLKNIFGIVAWSYLNHPLNFAGYTSVPMMLVWGVCGTAWFRVALPVFFRLYSYCKKHLSSRVFYIFTVIFMAYMALDITFTLCGFNCWYMRLCGEEQNTPIQQFFAKNYDDDYMSSQFGALSIHPEIVTR